MTEEQMRGFILLAESLGPEPSEDQAETIVETVQESPRLAEILGDLGDVAFRLRAFMESETGDYALGVETGMQRAADMIENVIRRYQSGDDHVE